MLFIIIYICKTKLSFRY